MDVARTQRDKDIERAERTRSMLEHLAHVVEDAPVTPRPGQAAYSADALDALLHGAELASKEKRNLKHVGRLYDAKVEEAVDAPEG